MRTKVIIKRALATLLIATMIMPTSVLADNAEIAEDISLDTNTEVTAPNDTNASEDVDVSNCDLEYYKYILDYYNIDEGKINYDTYKKQYESKLTESDSFSISAYEAFRKANHFSGKVPEEIETSSLPKEYYKDNNPYGEFNEYPKSLKIDETGFVDFEFEVAKSGLYNISLDFYNIKSKNSSIKRAVFIDGKLPYSELSSVELKRLWINDPKNYSVDSNGNMVLDKGLIEWKKDNSGNDLKVSQKEVHDWQRSFLYDIQGYNPDELGVYLEAGKHTITLYSITEEMVLYGINFESVKKLLTYDEYIKTYDKLPNNVSSNDAVVTIEAENASVKSSQMLYPQQDQSSSLINPSSARYLLNNVIGGNSWRLVGDWIEWDFSVKNDGYYNIDLLCKQNFSKGIYVSRKIMIDGEVPFAELNGYGFEYESSWFYEKLGKDQKNPYKIYLTAGDHKIRMQVILGEFGDIVGRVADVTDDLNKIYREVICVTGVSPDVWRDYQIETNLPGLTDELKSAYDKLDSIIKDFEKLVGGNGSDKERALTTMRTQVGEIIEDNEYFVKVVGDYRSNVRACGTWITEVIGQPLALDSISIVPAQKEVKHKSSGFFKNLWHEICRLFYSFIVDYDIVGDVSDPGQEIPELVLWVGTGRDQSAVIKSMIAEQFTSNYNINVTVMLVDINTLLQATLAGQGPDVAIEVNYDLPVNYGLRKAVYDLSNFKDLPEVLARFDKSAYEAYQHGNSTFALPCSQTFLAMFYRKDILKELNLEIPKTWQEMITALTVMSQNKMDLGMLPGEEVFLMYLLQNGGEYYNADGSKTILDEEEAINSFTKYCEMYTDYGVDKSRNVEQGFRTGETPIIISNFGFYNTLQVSAPDINGLWGVTHVPGTIREVNGETIVDGTIASVGNACVIMSACKDKESAWKFIKWWTEADTQVQYSHEMESINGPSAKVPTANIEAFQQIGYPVEFTEIINEQRKTIRGIRQVAGSYFTYRYINNAFYAVTADKDSSTPREELTDRVTYINDEIAYKRHELKLD